MPFPSGSVVRVQIHRAGQRVGDDERRRCQVVGADLLLDAAFEISVAAQHGRDNQAARVDLGRYIVRQRAAVADARRAAVADENETELIEIRVEPGLLQVVGDHFGAGRQARLDPRLALKPALDRLLREQPGANHDARIRGVRAARDGGNHHRTVIDGDLWRRFDGRAA